MYYDTCVIDATVRSDDCCKLGRGARGGRLWLGWGKILWKFPTLSSLTRTPLIEAVFYSRRW